MMEHSRKIARGTHKMFGPQRIIGKLHSSRNALKHGLSIRLGSDRGLHELARQIAHEIAGANADDALFEQALVFAETELELRRIGQIRLATIETAIATNSAHNLSRRMSDAAAQTETETADAFLHALPMLKAIERYQRRAYSRRRKALELFNALQACSCLPAKKTLNLSE
jgi:hypothetical protein